MMERHDDYMKTILLDEIPENTADFNKILVSSSTVIGKREEQQDALKTDSSFSYANEKRMIAVLCDGMGGMSGGEKASRLCSRIVHQIFHEMPAGESIPRFYKHAITRADEEVAGLRSDTGAPLRAGTTLVSVAVENGTLYWASVGDSRIYILRGNEILCITKDHNYMMLLMEKVKRGEISLEEANRNPKREALVSYIGMGGVRYIDANSKPFQLVPGDTILLCSDGLYRSVTENELRQTLMNSRRDMGRVANKLTDLALSKNMPHQDNTSVIVLYYGPNG